MADHIFKYNRYSIRMAGYDYSQSGYYFVTLCTQNRDKRFGVIRNKEMQLNNVGRMIDLEWKQIHSRFKYAIPDKYVIMPDHFHGIIQIISNKKMPVHDNNLPAHNENNVGTPLVGIHPKSQDHFNRLPDVYCGSQCTGITTLFEIIGAFKSITTQKYINGVKNNNWPRFNKRLWQLRYHDHIIRNEIELTRIRKYIIANPFNYRTP